MPCSTVSASQRRWSWWLGPARMTGHRTLPKGPTALLGPLTLPRGLDPVAGRTDGLEVGVGVVIARDLVIHLGSYSLAARPAELTDPPISEEDVTPYIGPVPRQTTGPVTTNPTNNQPPISYGSAFLPTQVGSGVRSLRSLTPSLVITCHKRGFVTPTRSFSPKFTRSAHSEDSPEPF